MRTWYRRFYFNTDMVPLFLRNVSVFSYINSMGVWGFLKIFYFIKEK